MPKQLKEIYELLLAHFGPTRGPPAETPLEALLSTILAQNAGRKNVELALANLRDADVLDVDRLHALEEEELAELLRPLGHFRPKARRLHKLLAFIVEQHGGSLEAMFATDPLALRQELLGILGVGPQTADSIMLHVGKLPTFVVDPSTHRVLARHGWIDFEADYHAIQDYFHDGLPADAELFGEFHALLDRVGQEYCRKTPKCDTCPLAQLLPEGGPLESPY